MNEIVYVIPSLFILVNTSKFVTSYKRKLSNSRFVPTDVVVVYVNPNLKSLKERYDYPLTNVE